MAKLELTGVRAPVAGEKGLARGEEQRQISGLLFSGIRRLSLSPATKVKGLQELERKQ